MWRRMVLWRIASFQDALEAEQERRHAIALLMASYGRRWKRLRRRNWYGRCEPA
jgi:hypothetical protein